MSVPQSHRSYLEIPDEVLQAETPVEFRELLNCIRKLAGLTNGQIATKTKIPRSQAYSLTATNRTTLPSKPEQVRAFVSACNVSPIQVGLVMSLWEKIDNDVKDKAPARTPNSIATHDMDSGVLYLPPTSTDSERSRFRSARTFFKPARRRERTISDLLFLVLDDDKRTERAIRLLVPVVLAITIIVLVLVVALIAWAILQPSTSFAAGIGFALIGGMLVTVIRKLRH